MLCTSVSYMSSPQRGPSQAIPANTATPLHQGAGSFENSSRQCSIVTVYLGLPGCSTSNRERECIVTAVNPQCLHTSTAAGAEIPCAPTLIGMCCRSAKLCRPFAPFPLVWSACKQGSYSDNQGCQGPGERRQKALIQSSVNYCCLSWRYASFAEVKRRGSASQHLYMHNASA